MEKLLPFRISIVLMALLALSACAKRASTPDQALTDAQETYDTMNTRYSKLISFKPMSTEAMQELRVLGVHRERTWFRIFL